MKESSNADRHMFTADEAFAVTAGALRYALGRHTYSTSLVWGLIKEHWDDPEVVRQHECIYNEVDAYVREQRNEGLAANVALPVLKEVEKMLVDAYDTCPVSAGKFALRAALDSVRENRQAMEAVPKFPDLDTEVTWLPALEWMRDRMGTPAEGSVKTNRNDTDSRQNGNQ